MNKQYEDIARIYGFSGSVVLRSSMSDGVERVEMAESLELDPSLDQSYLAVEQECRHESMNLIYGLSAVETTPMTIPAYEYKMPARGYTVPAYEYTIPAYEYSMPAYEYAIPAYEYTIPTYENTIPAYEYTMPACEYAIEQVEMVEVQNEVTAYYTEQMFHYLGVEEVDPEQYLADYGMELVSAEQLPREVHAFQTPYGEILAVNAVPDELPLLVGDVHVLGLIDMFCHGLAAYKCQFEAPLRFFGF